jgi:hypothetical protein
MPQLHNSPVDAIISQVSTLIEAQSAIMAAINEAHDTIDPDNATWRDVGKLAMLVDQVKRAGLVGDR